MASYRVLLSGLLLAVTLVNCNALPAEVEVSASLDDGIAETNGEEVEVDSGVIDETTTDTLDVDTLVHDAVDDEVFSESDSTAEDVVNDEDASTAEDSNISQATTEEELDDDEANKETNDSDSASKEQSESTDSESVSIDNDSNKSQATTEEALDNEEANVIDNKETNDSDTASKQESESTESESVAIDNDEVKSSYNVITEAMDNGQYNLINITGKDINDSIKVPGNIPIRTTIVGDKLVMNPFLYVNSTDKLVLVDGHKCVERTYSAGSAVSERNMTAAECHEVIVNMHRVQRQADEVARLSHELDDALAHPFGERLSVPHIGRGHGRGCRRGHHKHSRLGNRLLSRLAPSTAQNAQAQPSV